MSRPFIRKPEFRLHFGYPLITLTRGDDPAAVRVARLGEPSFPDDFCGLGDEVARADGQLTVVLPEAEVWRGLLDLAGRTAFGRWREARVAVAARLSLLPGALAVAVGPRDTFGRIPVAAVQRQTLRETRSFLAGGGLRPAAIIGAGTFPGFAAPPRFASGVRQLPALASLLRPERRGVAAAGLAATLMLATALGLALAPQAPAPRPGFAPIGPAPAAGPPAVYLAALVIPPPRPRPDPMPRPPANVARAAPPPQRAPAPAATVAARNLPLFGLGEVPSLPDGLRLAELGTARARLTDTLIATPLRRPGPPPAAGAPEPAAASLTGSPPMPRPAPVAAAIPAAKAPVAPGPQAARPMPRPETAGPALASAITEAVAEATAEPVVVASLAPAEAAAAGLAAALTAMPPVPRPAAPVRAAAPAPAPKAAAAPPTAVGRAAPPPRVVAVQPVRVQPAAPVRQQQAVRRVAVPAPKQVVRQPATTAASAGRTTARAPRNLALIGVFGASGDRHALVRLPTGDVKRVRPGDHLQGAQVAAVGSDSLRLLGGGREMVLRLP